MVERIDQISNSNSKHFCAFTIWPSKSFVIILKHPVVGFVKRKLKNKNPNFPYECNKVI